MFEPEVFPKQMHCIVESNCDIVGIFRRPPQSVGAPIVIRGPGNFSPLAVPSLLACLQHLDVSDYGPFKSYCI